MSDYSIESLGGMPSGLHRQQNINIKVLGVGGGGGNMLQYMINQSLNDVEFIAINTDAQALNRSTAPLKVQIGVKLTNGLGAGCDPNKGRLAAEESREDIKKLIQDSQMIFITAGLGGGTGTGAAPVIAQIARESGALTVGVVTKPFSFEGKLHRVNAEVSINELYKHVDSLIVVDNNKLIANLGASVSLLNAFNAANDVLLNAVRGITDTVSNHSYINVDFADIDAVMRDRGLAMIGTGVGQGANFIEDAIQRSIHSPLLDQVDISRATGLIVNARVNPNFPIDKWSQINSELQHYLDDEAACKFGLTFDDSLAEDQVMITVLITGISNAHLNTSNINNTARNNANIRRNAGFMNNQNGNFYNAVQQSPNGGMFTQQRQAMPRPYQQGQIAQPNMMGQNPHMQAQGGVPSHMGAPLNQNAMQNNMPRQANYNNAAYNQGFVPPNAQLNNMNNGMSNGMNANMNTSMNGNMNAFNQERNQQQPVDDEVSLELPTIMRNKA